MVIKIGEVQASQAKRDHELIPKIDVKPCGWCDMKES